MINKCKNLRIRQKKYIKYFYCLSKRHIISLDDCQNCSKPNLVANKPIKKASNKQKRLEKNRFSVFTTNFNKCYYCGKEGKMDLHEIYGGSNRKRSIKNGLVIPLCRICHSNEEIINFLRIKLQKEYEKKHSRDDFIKLIGKSYTNL